jgi:diaminohydroxyphosphoribosylaminopyrimidine deaminase/5-amino-6-(5-phosphoribosylamino)uracil reductase
MVTGRPYVSAKIAATLDGRVAAADGTSRWITGPEARAHAHAVRSEVGAVIVGMGTVLADDPALSARPVGEGRAGEGRRQPLRVVVGTRDLPAGARVAADPLLLRHLRTRDPAKALAALGAEGVRHVVVEGGPTLLGAFLRAGLVDEVHAYVAPVLLGSGASAVGDLGVATLGDAPRGAPRAGAARGDCVWVRATRPGEGPGPDVGLGQGADLGLVHERER